MQRRLVLAVTVLACALAGAQSAAAAPSELFFSEYIEGSSNNKALEIFNGTGAPVDLGTGGYNVQMFFNGSATAGGTDLPRSAANDSAIQRTHSAGQSAKPQGRRHPLYDLAGDLSNPPASV